MRVEFSCFGCDFQGVGEISLRTGWDFRAVGVILCGLGGIFALRVLETILTRRLSLCGCLKILYA